ncbi:hypothetical protein [Natrinema sp. H-ect4]|uniref:hypothetical protein n=1 Tax=Natrinema sp. H-ect4 TaxID=3242699 RepID=UPI0035A88AC9
MSDSSIPVSTEYRKELEERKRDGESYEAYLKRTRSDGSDESDSTDGSDISEVLSRLDDLETSIPTETAREVERQFR